MKVLPVRHELPKLQFKGIIVNEDRNVSSNTFYSHYLEGETGTETIINQKSYYPFKDETKKEIREAVAKHAGEPKKWNREFVECVEETFVHIKKKLPFTKEQFLEFTRKNPMSNDEIVKFAKFFELVAKR